MKVDPRKNMGLKLLSILMALFFWILVAGEEEIVKDLVLPLELINLPSSLEISGHIEDTVVVRVRAPEAILKSLSEDRMDARLDLKGVHSGRIPFTLTPDHIRVHPDAKIVRIRPEIVELNLEPKRQKEIPIVQDIQGSPAPGFEVEEVSVSPSTIRIEGPESEVQKTEKATTGPIFLNGEKESLQVSVNPMPLAPRNSRVRTLRPEPALVIIRIREQPVKRNFPQVPVLGIGARFRTRIHPTTLQITLEGPASLIQQLDSSDLRAEVALETLDPGGEDYRVEPRIVFPELSPDQAGALQVVTLSQTFVNVRVYTDKIEKQP